MRLTLYTLTGKFAVLSSRPVATIAEGLAIATTHAEAAGYTRVRVRDDLDPADGYLIVARTPGGRNGRNVASLDWDEEGL